jgi:protein gp37
MALHSTIEWTEATWNPVRGCTKISAGCKFCYAQRFAERFRGVCGHPYEQGFDLRLVPEKLGEPLRWHEPRRIFVNSMSDLFHEGVPESYISAVFQVMKLARWHTFQVLTKRAFRLKNVVSSLLREATNYDHIWWGVSVENKKQGLPRIQELRETGVPMRFLSIEPLLENLGEIDLRGISWVIVGGESGPGARPMDKEWVLSIREQCQASGVPFFFKQWGGVRKSRTGRRLQGKVYDQQPAVSSYPVKPRKERLEYATLIENSLMHEPISRE